MEKAIELYAAVTLLVIGLSHLFQPKGWVAFYADLVAKGVTGAFAEGFLCLSFGGIIVAFAITASKGAGDGVSALGRPCIMAPPKPAAATCRLQNSIIRASAQ